MDKKIQDAAGSFQPPFREDDWNGMNALLDKHLPQEKKRRTLPGLLLFLLAGIPALVMLTTYKVRPADPLTGAMTTAQSSTPLTAQPDAPDQPHPSETETTTSAIQPASPVDNKTSGLSKQLNDPGTVYNDQPGTSLARKNAPAKHSAVKKNKKPSAIYEERSSTWTTASTVQEQPPPTQTKQQAGSDTINHPQPAVATPDTATAITITKQPDSLRDAQQPSVQKKKEQGPAKSGKWQISFSAGPDLTSVGVEKTGKWRMQYGIGVSYAINNRFQIRTGLMAGRKVYYADSSDYHPPKGFWSYYPNLEKIDANCLVYEIPLNVVYTFPSSKKHQWFVSTGLSSYLMKEETYEYYYKDPWGTLQYRERTIKNENDHFFSILQLSGGYRYKFSDRLSLMAEPYAKLPLSGVGFGKVKLNNTGVLFTVGFKPFAKRN